MSERPAFNRRLCDIDPARRRGLASRGAFLHVVNLPGVQLQALLAGYDADLHGAGAYAARWLAGEGSFEESRSRGEQPRD